jgi:hypothetical protein
MFDSNDTCEAKTEQKIFRKIKLTASAAENKLYPVPQWLNAARAEKIFPTNSSPSFLRMRSALCAVLGCDDSEQGLALSLHLLEELPKKPPLCPTLMHAYKLNGRKIPTRWKRAMLQVGKGVKQLEKSPDYQAYIHAYHMFMREVIAPMCGDPSG